MGEYATLVDNVKLQAMALPDGCSDGSLTCPMCGKSDSFNVTRDGNVLKFICFHASCPFKGVTGDKSSDLVRPVVRKKKLFDGHLDFLNAFEEQWLHERFQIDKRHLAPVRWGTEDSRVYYPQYNVDGRIGGYIARYYPELNFDKPTKGAKAFWKATLERDCGLMFPNMKVASLARKTKRCVLVEDYPSALRIVSQLGIACACMGGTNLYDSMVSTLIALGVEHVAVVLDNDACDKAVHMQQLLSFAIPDTITIPLMNKDVKDMSLSECAETFKEFNHE